VSPNTQILISDVFNIELKKKKRVQFNFQVQQDAPDGGMLKGKSVKAPPGIGKDAYPDIREPVKVEHTRGNYGGGGESRQMEVPSNNRPPPSSRRGPPSNNNDDDAPPPSRRLPPPTRRVPPSNNNNDDDGDNQAPPPTRRLPPGRLPLPGRGGPPPM